MRLITFQHKSILKDIERGTYKCNYIGNYQKRTPISYDFIRKQLECKIRDNVTNPIFAWNKVIDNKEISTSEEEITRMLEMTPFDLDDYLMFELDVPEEYILLTDFYSFVDMRYYEEFESENFDINKFSNYTLLVENEMEIQAIIPEIKFEWLLNVFSVENEKNIIKTKLEKRER